MKGKEIKELQNKLFDHLETYFGANDFQLVRKDWSIISKNHSIDLYINTTHFDSYTLRPGITILYKSLFDKIQMIVQNEDFKIFHNGNFNLNQKLANVFDIHDFDECQENGFNKSREYFIIDVKNDNTFQVANRLFKIIDSFGLKTISATSDLINLYEFYKKIISLLLEEFDENPHKKATEYGLGLDINAYLTFVYLGIKNADNEIFEIISKWNKIQNNRAYYVDPVNKIISHFK